MGVGSRAEHPGDGNERSILTGWLAFHRDAMATKCHGLTDDQLVERAAEPSSLSLLGLVRHMAEMERAYGGWALGPKADFEWVWGIYENDAEHDFDCDASMVTESTRVWKGEMRKTDEALSQHPTLDESGDGNGYSVRWNLAKLGRRSGPVTAGALRAPGRGGRPTRFDRQGWLGDSSSMSGGAWCWPICGTTRTSPGASVPEPHGSCLSAVARSVDVEPIGRTPYGRVSRAPPRIDPAFVSSCERGSRR